jgi:lipopolysaccharide transport system ATP-binding protein
MHPAIAARHLGKRFRRYDPQTPRTFQEALQRGLKFARGSDYFWPFRDVSFEIQAGQTVGVIGANGAGKSTLLKMIGGVGRPDRGTIEVNGRIGTLELCTGFHPELTGRENIFVSAVIGGLTRREVCNRFDSIVAFCELNEFIDYPLYTYSSGMQMRLAFAVAVHTDPEILLIDEVLAVGDAAFQRKCFNRIADFKARNCTIVLVTQDLDVVENLCDQALLLGRGRLVCQGRPVDVVDRYLAGDHTDGAQLWLQDRSAI